MAAAGGFKNRHANKDGGQAHVRHLNVILLLPLRIINIFLKAVERERNRGRGRDLTECQLACGAASCWNEAILHAFPTNPKKRNINLTGTWGICSLF